MVTMHGRQNNIHMIKHLQEPAECQLVSVKPTSLARPYMELCPPTNYIADYTLSACFSPCRSTAIRFIPNNYGIWHRYGQDCPPEALQNRLSHHLKKRDVIPI